MKDNRTRVFLRPGSIAFRSQFSGFLTDEQSPFRDRYDWLQEERVVDELIASGIDAGSKEYGRIIEYEGRISVLKMWVFQHLKDNGLLRTNASIKNTGDKAFSSANFKNACNFVLSTSATLTYKSGN